VFDESISEEVLLPLYYPPPIYVGGIVREETMKKERIIQLPKIYDERGNLSFIQPQMHLPFSIARCYWIYDVPGGEFRGSHAFRTQEEFIVALSGSFDVLLDDGTQEHRYTLNRSYQGVYVPRMTWRTLENFSTNSLCLVLSSTTYEEEDYIWDYAEFLSLRKMDSSLPEHKALESIVDALAVSNKKAAISALIAEQRAITDVDTSRVTTTGGEVEIPSNSGADGAEKEVRKKTATSIVNSCATTVEDCMFYQLPQDHSRQGNLTALNNGEEIPFAIKRVFYLYDIPSGVTRGAHAHRKDTQFLVAASSSFDVRLFDGKRTRVVRLDQPNKGLLIPPGIWCQLVDFSSAAICMTLTAREYEETDYIRCYDDFMTFKKCK